MKKIIILLIIFILMFFSCKTSNLTNPSGNTGSDGELQKSDAQENNEAAGQDETNNYPLDELLYIHEFLAGRSAENIVDDAKTVFEPGIDEPVIVSEPEDIIDDAEIAADEPEITIDEPEIVIDPVQEIEEPADVIEVTSGDILEINEPEAVIKPEAETAVQQQVNLDELLTALPAAQPQQPVQTPTQPAQTAAQPQQPAQAATQSQQPAQPQQPVQTPTAQPVQTPAVQPQQPVQTPTAQPVQTPAVQPQQHIQTPTAQPVQTPAAQQTIPPVEETEPEILPLVRPLRDALSDTEARDRSPSPAQSVIVPQDNEIVFSRVVRAITGQVIEIPFTGTGWVYLGELMSQRGLVYNSRRLDPQGQSFIFTAEEAGNFALKFYKQDFIRDYILNDHVRVIVGNAPVSEGTGWFNPPADRGRVVAYPRWPSAEEESQIQRGSAGGNTVYPETRAPVEAAAQETSRAAQPASAPETPAQDQGILPRDILLQRAKEAFEGGNITGAIALLNQYTGFYSEYPDEILWLYGQAYEANSLEQNILLSLDHYRRLVREYPQSARFNDARRRIAYLERFYINIQ